MTDQEKKQQRVSLGIEIEDAREEFSHLREKALHLADHLEQITNMLRINANRKPTADDFEPDFELANRLRPEHQAVLSFDEINKLIESIRAARKRAYNLLERRSQLSSGDFSATV